LQANKAALKAVIVNRIGDVCIILGAGLVFLNANSLDFSVVSAQVS
jgi:NADH:ubiquinone oxidoreductase subunit 5 (subunit L)/multisubunit Na+/H+ antiporter MnhA subunit